MPAAHGHDGAAPDAAQRIYLKPLAAPGLCGDDTFALAGGPLRFSQCELIERRRDDVTRRRLPATAAQALSPQLFDRLTAPRPPLAGLDWQQPRLMAVLNVTPDSFFDGGRFDSAEDAVAAGKALLADGADIVDVGGESTRPGAVPVSTDEELARVGPVLAGLVAAGVPVSVDTRRAAVMQAAVSAGAVLINDVSALGYDPASAAVAAESGVPVVLMHSRGEPDTMARQARYDDVVLDVYDELQAALARAEAAGIDRERVLIDPGIGFAKTARQSVAVLADLSLLHGLGCPLLIGASRKSFIAGITGEVPAERRLPGSLTAVLAGRAAGVQAFRVHDVMETRQALTLWEATVAAVGRA